MDSFIKLNGLQAEIAAHRHERTGHRRTGKAETSGQISPNPVHIYDTTYKRRLKSSVDRRNPVPPKGTETQGTTPLPLPPQSHLYGEARRPLQGLGFAIFSLTAKGYGTRLRRPPFAAAVPASSVLWPSGITSSSTTSMQCLY
jgi:hypothetical protein